MTNYREGEHHRTKVLSGEENFSIEVGPITIAVSARKMILYLKVD